MFRDGIPVAQGTSATLATFNSLQPSTTYTFTAVARDNDMNWSAVSAPLTVTTPAADAGDLTPPTAPTNVGAELYGDGSRELQVSWTQSTDDRDPQSMILYQVYVNGVIENSVLGKGRIDAYGVAGDNKIEVFAFDTAGNESAPGVFNLFIPF